MSSSHEIAVEIGGMPILVRTADPSFRELLASRYAGFIGASAEPSFELDVDLVPPSPEMASDEDVRVEMQGGQWHLRRGDFRAQWDPRLRRGRVRQTANPYSIDSVLRIVHTLVLAREGGFLLHAASAIRQGRAFLFSGVSGAGKTTISRLAPPDAILLSDEISYVRRAGEGYSACGTPFAGELARVGENCSAPIGTLYFLAQGPENRIEPVNPAEAARCLLRNVLFFAEDAELVKLIFRSACEFVDRVPVQRLTFVPDQRVWDLIQ
ncbi:MAG: hypothetical protein LAO03_05010 [Acidobacteriia bacterium]|nr:hypothetical protein [Terriglobia bacterium]